RSVRLAPTGAWETGRIVGRDRAQAPFGIEGPCGRWMPRFRRRRDVGLAPLDFLFEPRFPVVRAGMVAHLTQDDDLAPHVVDLSVCEEDAHFLLLLLRHSRHVALRPSTEVQSALNALAGRRCRHT